MKFFIFAFLIIFSFDSSAQVTSAQKVSKTSSDSVSAKKNTVKTTTELASPSKSTGKTTSVTDTSKTKTSSIKVVATPKPAIIEQTVKTATDTTVSKTVETKTKAVQTTAISKASSDSSTAKTNAAKTPPAHVSATSLAGLKVYDANNEQFYLDSLSQGKPTVVIFVSIKCLVSGLYNERYNELYNDYVQKATFVFINPNEEESWTEIQKYFKDNSLIFDIVKDKAKITATALNVTKIPTAFIFRSDGSLAYRGKIDNNPRVQGTVYGSQLQVNLDKVINGEEINPKETSPVGCDLNKPEKPAPKPADSEDSPDGQ